MSPNQSVSNAVVYVSLRGFVSFHLRAAKVSYKQPLSVFYKVLPPPQCHAEPVLSPTHPLIQQQVRVSKDARVKQCRLGAPKEPRILPQQRRERLEGLVGLAVQVIGVDDGRVSQELGFRRGAEAVRYRGAHEGVGGCREHVELVCDFGKVRRL